jgi:hypothetical protein
MKHGQDNLGAKRPRYHPVIAWEQQNLTNDFVDISRVALDNRYGKVGGSLYKRRNGSGPTDGKTQGLFGLVDYDSQTNAFFGGAATAVAIYVLSDWYLNKGYQLKGWKRRFARSPMTFGLGILAFYAVTPKN